MQLTISYVEKLLKSITIANINCLGGRAHDLTALAGNSRELGRQDKARRNLFR
jgi:hypothetical protein